MSKRTYISSLTAINNSNIVTVNDGTDLTNMSPGDDLRIDGLPGEAVKAITATQIILERPWPLVNKTNVKGINVPTADDFREATKLLRDATVLTSSNMSAVNSWTTKMGTVQFTDPAEPTVTYTVKTIRQLEQDAAVSIDSAIEGANRAEAARDATEGFKTAAAASATSALSSKNTATTQATLATTKATEASSSASNASVSASTSSTKAVEASTSATNAASSATAASGSASAALSSENKAKTSETNSKASENASTLSASAANTSEGIATTAKNQASTSATNAANSASAANSSATSASNSATTATTKASEASTSASNAAGSATTATTKASEASASATAASNSASAALTSKNAAAASATAADGSKTAAASSASAAALSKGNAEGSATTALTAKTQAETNATSAANSASAALASKNAAATSATNAAGSAATSSTKAGEASSSASSALASKNAASLSESSATASKVASKASEDAAKMSELAAYASELGSSASAGEADASESAAKSSEANSIANATASYNYSELARGYANDAEVSKGESQAAAVDADNSADASLLSANAAKASELIAKASEVASKASETAAKSSETASKASELAAKASETTANTKAVQTAANAVTTAGHVTQTANNAALAETAKNAAEAAASTIVGGIVDKGAWNASTGVFPEKPTRPLPEGGTALVSGFWKVTVAGTAGGIIFLAGDDLRFSAGTDTFYKIDNTDAVASVQGKTGAVTLTASEVGALATPTGTHAVDTVLVAGATAGTSKHSGFTLGKSVPSNAVFTDTVYTHPTNDGNLHVPATGTTNSGKALVAGATAGSATWKTLTSVDISGLDAALNTKLAATANAVSATKLQNPVTVNGVAFDGSANITISASSPATLTRGTGLTGADYNGASATTWAVAYGTAAGTACQGNDARLSDARTPLAHSHVWADVTGKPTTLAGYGITDAPTKTGSGASGSWGISVTGNAATATKLATVRTINGVNFDGTANITIADSTKLPLTGGTLTGNLTAPTFIGAFAGTATAASQLNTIENTDANVPLSGTGLKAFLNGDGSLNFPSAYGTGFEFNRSAGVTTSEHMVQMWSPSNQQSQLYLRMGSGNGTTITWGSWSNIYHAGYNNIGTGATNYAAGDHNHSSISGNAATATTLQTARTIGMSGVTATATSFNGSANIVIPITAVPTTLLTGTVPDARISGSYTGMTNLTGTGIVDFSKFYGNAADTVTAPSFSWTTDTDTGIYSPAADQLAITTGGIQRALFSSAGVAATTFTGALSGNATTATTLQTDRTLTIGSIGKSFNGSANVAWSLAEIGAQPAGSYAASSHTHPWAQISGIPVQATRWPTPAEVGLGNVVNKGWNYGAIGDTYAVRNVNGDLVARQFHGTHVGDGSNLFNLQWARLTGVPVQATRWPTPLEITAAQSGGIRQTGSDRAISTSEFVTWVKSVGGISTNQWSCKMTWSYANNNFINDTGVGNIQLAGATITTWGNTSAYTIEVITAPASKVDGNRPNARYIYQNHGEAYSPAWVRSYDSTNKPTPSEIGAQPAGSYAEASHTHPWTQISGIPVQATRWPTPAEVGAQPAGSYAASSHTHDWSQVTGQPVTATRWPTFAEVTAVPATATRWPTFAEVSGKPTNYATTWESVAAKPETATRWPTLAEIGAQPAGSYAADSHTHSYAPLTGTGTSGSWPISVTGSSASTTGNAATATTLQTARTIAISGAVTGTATSFNGGANITIAATALNASNLSAGTVPDVCISGAYTGLTNLTGTGTVDFSRFLGNAADTVAAPSFSWTGDLDTGIYSPVADQLAITTGGVQRALFNSSGVTATTFSGALSGNATTATTLQTARTINGVSFNGSANITVTAAANGGTSAACSGNSATATLASTVVVNGSADNNFYDMLWRSGNTVYAADSSKATLNPATGDMRLGGHVAFAYTSDENLKTGITEIGNPLDKVCSLRTATYLKKSTLADEDGKYTYTPETGFIAQDLEKVIPNLISVNDHGYKTINGGGFEIEALLAGAIKELKKQHDEEIAALKEQIATLMKLV